MACAKYFLSQTKPGFNQQKAKEFIKCALKEDIGRGDITTRLNIPKKLHAQAKIIAREDFLLCGIELAKWVFKTFDPGLMFKAQVKEGSLVTNNQILAIISGNARSILTSERVALNLLSFLSGIATKTLKFTQKIQPFKAKITDTRKTIPGLRDLQKYAIRIGSGYNHRMCLDEMVLIKDNHLKIIGGINRLPKVPLGCKIEIEAQNLKEFQRALVLAPDIIMLDNMQIKDIQKAVKIRNQKKNGRQSFTTLLEASGGIHLGNIKKYAATGVDLISVGELTDSIQSTDISLELC